MNAKSALIPQPLLPDLGEGEPISNLFYEVLGLSDCRKETDTESGYGADQKFLKDF